MSPTLASIGSQLMFKTHSLRKIDWGRRKETASDLETLSPPPFLAAPASTTTTSSKRTTMQSKAAPALLPNQLLRSRVGAACTVKSTTITLAESESESESESERESVCVWVSECERGRARARKCSRHALARNSLSLAPSKPRKKREVGELWTFWSASWQTWLALTQPETNKLFSSLENKPA